MNRKATGGTAFAENPFPRTGVVLSHHVATFPGTNIELLKAKWGCFFLFLCLFFLTTRAYSQELPGTNDFLPYPLDSWSFDDTTNWTSDDGFAPVSFTNITSSLFGDYTSLIIDTNIPASLQFNTTEADGTNEIAVSTGTVAFWFAPDWDSVGDDYGGNGPGEWGRFVEIGSYTTNASYGWWSILTDPGGTNLYFMAQTNNGTAYTLSAPIDLETNEWDFYALTYSPTNVSLYVDGQLLTNDPGGLSIWPGTNVLAHGFYIGSDTSGVYQAHGAMDDVQTYNVVLSANDVQEIYNGFWPYYHLMPWNVPAISSAPSNPSDTPTYYEAITGTGDLQPDGFVSGGYNGTNSYNVWLTNVTASVANNGTITFTIAGGSNGVPYDVFANSVLSFGPTGYPWSWMGQGYQWNTYTITNIGASICFIILGTPQDSDNNGLTDAYEFLVSQTDPYVDDQDGSGLSDSWQVLLGLNPLVNQVAQPSTRSNYSYNPVDWWSGVSGIRTGTNSTDAEGNILTVSE
ncbi:MAG TPA: LamG domain-containing protein [Verrucomicrobiae bacterium]|jgi:hypothetical protein